MAVRWSVIGVVCLLLPVALGPLEAQSATSSPSAPFPALRSTPRFAHKKKLVATYDSVADTTHLALVTHKGKYFLTIQRPRLTWWVDYRGHTPGAEPPAIVTLEFRTQAPQIALNARLTVTFGMGESFEVTSAGAFSDPGVQTWSHYMRFPVPCQALAAALVSDQVTVTVGGIVERLKPDEIHALRDLLARVRAWPPVGIVPGGA